MRWTLDSPWRSWVQISWFPFAARPTQPSIFPRSEYQIVPGLTLGHRRWGLLPSTTTDGMTKAKYLRSQVCRSHPSWLFNGISRLRVSSYLVCYTILRFVNIYRYFRWDIWRKTISRGTLEASLTKMLVEIFFCSIKRNKKLSKSYLNDPVYIQILTNL